jgi:hypothetical protein
MATEVKIPSGSRLPNMFRPIDVMEIGDNGMPGELIIHNGKLYLYGENGETVIDGGYVMTGALLANSITASKLTVSSQGFLHDLVWTATDENTCSWSAGTITWADGTTTTILAGNTGNIAATTYIYYNNSSTLATTTNIISALGDTKRLLAIVEIGDTGGKCIITPISSGGTTIKGDQIVTGKVQSIDSKTYFDLSNNRLVVNDEDSVNRVLIGKKT